MKRTKIVIDACMVLILVLLFITPRMNLTLHIILGLLFIPVISIHLKLNFKWLAASIKKIISGKLSPNALYMLILVFGLTVSFIVCTYTGIADYILDIPLMHRLHVISALVFVIITVLHVKVHWKYIKWFDSIKSKNIFHFWR